MLLKKSKSILNDKSNIIIYVQSEDIDILVNNKENIKDRFWETFLKIADESHKQKWQDTITQSGWSSHMMAVCKKR
jgi:hypothetical protein